MQPITLGLPPHSLLAHSRLPINPLYLISCFIHSQFSPEITRGGHSIYEALRLEFFRGSLRAFKNWSSLPQPFLYFRFSCVSVLPNLSCRPTANTREFAEEWDSVRWTYVFSWVRLLGRGWNAWPFASSLITIVLTLLVWGVEGKIFSVRSLSLHLVLSTLKAQTLEQNSNLSLRTVSSPVKCRQEQLHFRDDGCEVKLLCNGWRSVRVLVDAICSAEAKLSLQPTRQCAFLRLTNHNNDPLLKFHYVQEQRWTYL